MQKIISVHNNLSRGETDRDLMGRNDLPIYKNGSERFRNFWSNFKGNAIYRPGFEMMVEFEDCNMVEFKFSQTQDYLILFYKEKMKFLSYAGDGSFGFVQSGGADLEVATPYSLAESKEIQFAQNADVMYVVHEDYEPYKLTRTGAAAFTFATFVRTADPFDDPSTGTVGYPSAVTFFQGRLYYASSTLKGTTVWGSKSASYDNMTTGAGDDDGLEITIADLTERITWIKNGQKSLICGNAEGIVPINGGSETEPITPSTITAHMSHTDGSDYTIPVHKDGLLFYIKYDQRNLKYFQFDLLSETFDADDANAVSYDITEGKMKLLYHIKDRNDLMFMLSEEGDFISLNFNLKEKIAGWHRHDTQGTIKDIVRMYDQDKKVHLFALVQRTNGWYIEKLSEIIEFPQFEDYFTDKDSEKADREAFNRVTAEKLKECRYLDSHSVFSDLRTSTITYDATAGTISGGIFKATDVGKNIVYKTATGKEYGYFEITSLVSVNVVGVTALSTITDTTYSSWYLTTNKISGLTHLVNQTVGVVADGGYIGDYEVDANGTLSLDRQVSLAVIGLRYTGFIKSYPIGMLVQLINTQLFLKSVSSAHIQCVDSAGGEFGTTPYKMTEIQKYRTSGAIYDLPPLPMNGRQQIMYSDGTDLDKRFYIKQTKPLPLNITSATMDVLFGDRL